VRFQKFALATAQRAENVDNPQVLENLMEAFMESPILVVYPMHPPHRKKTETERVLQQSQKI